MNPLKFWASETWLVCRCEWLLFMVCWYECYALYFEIYEGRKSPRIFSDVVVTTADRQRHLVGDISFLKTKLSSR